MKTFSEFEAAFDRKVKSERKSDYFGGMFCFALAIALITIIEFNLFPYSGSKLVYYGCTLVIVSVGITVLYWIKIRYSISAFAKHLTDEEIQAGIEAVKQKYGMDLLKQQGTFYCLYFKPGFWKSWTEVNMLYDEQNIYINARPIQSGNVDFGFGKRLERKLVMEIKARATTAL